MSAGAASIRSQRAWGAASGGVTETLRLWSMHVVDAALAGLLFVAPLWLGGRHDLGRLVYVTLCVVAATACCMHQMLQRKARWTRSKTFLLPVAATALVVLQVIPLPPAFRNWIAPRIAELLPLWNADSSAAGSFGEWATLSLAPADTRMSLWLTLASGMLFVTVVQRLRTIDDIERLLRGIGLAAVGMAVLGLAQYFFGNGLYFWFYRLAGRSTDHAICGAFENRNHFAHFLALGVGPLAAWLLVRHVPGRRRANRQLQPFGDSQRDARHGLSIALGLALAVVLFAALLTLSRGGAAALAVATSAMLLGGRAARVIHGRHLLGAAVIGVAVVGLLSVKGYDEVAQRLGDYATGSLESLDGAGARRKIWTANLAASRQGLMTGSGVGSHAEIYKLYLPQSLPIKYTHAENGYLQVLTEVGAPGAALLTVALLATATCAFRALTKAPDVRSALCACAAAAGLSASVLHSVVDFVWYIPACLTVTLMLAACAVRLSHLASPRTGQRVTWGRPAWRAATLGVAIVGIWCIGSMFGHGMAGLYWERFRVISRAHRGEESELLRTDDSKEAQQRKERCELFDATMIAALEQVVAWRPDHPEAHLRLAERYLRRFETLNREGANAMALNDIRDTVAHSQFGSRTELFDWLRQAFGDNAALLDRAHRHTRLALRINPLQGEAYLQLARLCFLEGRGDQAVEALVQQALRTRPYDGDVLFSAGWQYLQLYRPDMSEKLWRKAFGSPGQHQLRVIAASCPHVPASTFIAMFQPDWSTLEDIWRRYQTEGSDDDRQALLAHGYREAEKAERRGDPKASRHWMVLARMASQWQRSDLVLTASDRAVGLAPDSYPARRVRALALFEAGKFAAAEADLRWCLARKRDDPNVQRKLAAALIAQSNLAAEAGAKEQVF